MSRVSDYIASLASTPDWAPSLLAESRLPGPRANLELLEAVARTGDSRRFDELLEASATLYRDHPASEFLAACAVVGFGECVARGDLARIPLLREAANDERWRVREAAAMGLQRWGAKDFDALVAAMRTWADGTRYDQRAAVAALCEPDLLTGPDRTGQVLDILAAITRSIVGASDSRQPGFVALRKALGYGWSVVIAADPAHGQAAFEPWLAEEDRDVRWVVRENLGKARMAAADARWLAGARGLVASASRRSA